ncbi:MAG: GGDEF domain-containing protein [Oscillospiraceae bacterium]|nr:GGDEF domain-containing protein [Oscillospiraceae bacterium]
MINSRKTIAVFGCCFTSRYRVSLSHALNTAAEEQGVNLVYINFLGNIGNINVQYGLYEFDLLDHIDLSQFDGIIYDGEGYNVEGMAEKVIQALRKATCPIVSISNYVEGFHNLYFDDAVGQRMMIEHFLDHHHFTKLGYMAGYLTHPDAQLRLHEFRTVMREHGLPEDGVGVFEGDFWFHKGKEAADFFLSLPQRPEAVVCANDYMAIALASEFRRRGIFVPEDIAVSGYDGTIEGQEFIPHLTSVTRERLDIAKTAIRMVLQFCDSEQKNAEKNIHIAPRPIYSQSCGCLKVDYRSETENINRIYDVTRELLHNLYDAESSLLNLNRVVSVRDLERTFHKNAANFGKYASFFLMMHADENGIPSYDSDFTHSSGNFEPLIWIDNQGKYDRREQGFCRQKLIPHSSSDAPHIYYIMSIHCAERVFGYSLVEMEEREIFNEYYNMWMINLAVTLEQLLKSDRINKLINKLEDISIRDALTGMFNRRGFDERSREAIRSINSERLVCTMVIDMDGLKHINDVYGHHEGDRAIKAAAEIITKCCESGEIAGRAGGDEFYVFAPDYTEGKLLRFVSNLRKYIKQYNADAKKSYEMDLSFGTFLTMTDGSGRLDDFLRISDSRMYEQKQAKPNRRK